MIIGGGWIGLETAAARAAGVAVTVLEAAELPLLRVLGREVAQIFADLHRRNGVDLRCGISIAEITGTGGVATGIRLTDGSRIPAGAVIVGAGIIPNTGLAEAAGLKVDNGVWVDESLQTSNDDVYAAGDVANAYHPAAAPTSASSTGPTPSINRRWWRGRCSAKPLSMTGCRISSPISTT